MPEPIRIQFVTTGLGLAGAEGALWRLLSRMNREQFSTGVVSLMGEGHYGPLLRGQSIPVEALGMSRVLPNPAAFVRLGRALHAARPDLVQTWMYHADLMGGFAAWMQGIPVLWSLRQSNTHALGNKLRTRMVRRACAGASWFVPRVIVCNSERSRRSHYEIGYDERRMTVIPNGFDMDSLARDASMPRRLRETLGLPAECLVVGHVARLNYQKGHPDFIAAMGELLSSAPAGAPIHAVMCGEGVTLQDPELSRLVEATGAADRFHLLGPRADAAALMSGMDVFALSSVGEGFPNVVAEAMCNEVPCVATDVGDAAQIVGDTGVVVSPNDPSRLAKGIAQLLDAGEAQRRALGRRARERIAERFGLDRMVRRFEDLYRETAAR